MSQVGEQPQEALRWYTRARRIPRLIGRLGSAGSKGVRLPGGPYTIAQVVGAAGVFVLGQQTMPLWGLFGVLTNYGLLTVVAVGALLGLGLIKPGGRDPVSVITAMVAMAARPVHGRQAGRPLRARKGHQVSYRVNCYTGPPYRPAVPEPEDPPEQPPGPVGPAPTAVQRLRAGLPAAAERRT